jgi:hypothetical protein
MTYRFKCSSCDSWHEGFPDIGFDQPLYASEVPEHEGKRRVFLTTDLCVVDDEHFFVRCILFIPIEGIDDQFGWGVWSTLSKKNFLRYQEHYEEDMSGWQPMFGLLSNQIPEYPDTLNLKLSLQTKKKNARPNATLEPTDHPLAVDQKNGMSLEKALKIADPFLH